MKNLYVTNLSYLIDNQRLTEIFSPYGDVLSAKVIMDRETGRSRGFGFVEMNGEGALSAIKALNGKEVEGRVLTVNEARPREPSRNHLGQTGRDRTPSSPSRRFS